LLTEQRRELINDLNVKSFENMLMMDWTIGGVILEQLKN
jgi:hypothetical protein